VILRFHCHGIRISVGCWGMSKISVRPWDIDFAAGSFVLIRIWGYTRSRTRVPTGNYVQLPVPRVLRRGSIQRIGVTLPVTVRSSTKRLAFPV